MAYGPFDFSMPTPQGQPGFLDTLGQAISDPRVMGFIGQAGLQGLMSPGWGQTPSDTFAMMLGAGGEAVHRGQEEERKQQEAASKAELRTSQAQLAEAKAGTAGMGYDLQREKLKSQDFGRAASAYVGAIGRYNQEMKQIRDENFLAPPGKEKPIPSFDDWLDAKGFGWLRGFGRPGYVPGVSTTPTPQAPKSATPPKVGDVVDGFRYKGGDPSNPNSWEQQ